MSEAPAGTRDDFASRRIGETLGELLRGAVERFGDRVAVRGPDGSGLASLSYVALSERSAAVRDQLASSVRRGEFVVLCGHNSNAWIAAFFGISRCGAIPVPVNPDMPGDELQAILNELRPAALIGDRDLLAHLAGAAPLMIDLDSTDAAPLRSSEDADPRPDDLAVLIYTTGTTGPPKGVMLTHRNLLSNAAAIAQLAGLRGNDVVLVPLPLYHSFPLTVGMLAPLAAGVRIELESRPSRIAARLRDARPTHLIGVPALYELLLARVAREVGHRRLRRYFQIARLANRELIRRLGLNAGRLLFRPLHGALGGRLRVAISGGARLAPELQREALLLGIPLLQGFGMSEASPVIASQRFDPGRLWRGRHYWDHAGSCGPPLPGVAITIDPIDGADPGVGEILVQGPNVMSGYFQREQETRAVLREGKLHTGDVGRIDAEGELWILGRIGTAVSTPRGKIIHLERIEEAIGLDPAIDQVAVVVEETPGWRLVAIVYPSAELDVPGATAEAVSAAVREACRRAGRTLDAVERVSEVRLSDRPLPVTPIGKLRRAELPAAVQFDIARWRDSLAARAGEGRVGPHPG